MWDMRTGRALSSVLHHTDHTRSLDFSRDGGALLTASYDGLVGVCDCRPRVASAASPGESSNGDGGGAAGDPQVCTGWWWWGGRVVLLHGGVAVGVHRGFMFSGLGIFWPLFALCGDSPGRGSSVASPRGGSVAQRSVPRKHSPALGWAATRCALSAPPKPRRRIAHCRAAQLHSCLKPRKEESRLQVQANRSPCPLSCTPPTPPPPACGTPPRRRATQVDLSVLAMLRAHGGRVLQAKWKPHGGDFGHHHRAGGGSGGGGGGFSRPAFLTSSTDCTVMLWSLAGATAAAAAGAG